MGQPVSEPLEFLKVIREPILCPNCGCYLGEHIGPLFLCRYHQRFIASPLPAFIICERCSGIWRNEQWTASLEGVVQFLREQMPEQPLPPIKWEHVPNERRPARFREQT